MDIIFTEDERRFRDEVRQFLGESCPPDIRRKMYRKALMPKEDIVRWHKILHAKGWSVPHWPQIWGGTGWSAVQRYIFLEELHQWPAPEPVSFNTTMVGPVVIAFGSNELKQRFLPQIASLDLWFCQGFSEPNAGSDLAALRTRAERDGDSYILNGQKMWTSTAHEADWMFALVRTDGAAKKQEGISFILVDMKSPGVEVRQIRTIDGIHHVNEVFLTDVRVPAGNLVGQENRGWDCAKFLLGNERMGIARVGISKGRIAHAKAIAAQRSGPRGILLDDPRYREQVGLVEIELKALELTAMRLLHADRNRTDSTPNPLSSVLKIKGAETQQASAEILLKSVGPTALEFGPRHDRELEELADVIGWGEGKASTYFLSRATSIYGGSAEIQRNILAKTVLGL